MPKKEKFPRTLFFLSIFLFTLLVYWITSPGPTPYDYFGRLAQSIAQGKIYLTENPPWLNELVPIGNKYYIVYPPLPAFLMAPFSLFLPEFNFQTIFSIILGSINAGLVYELFQRLKFSKKTSIVMSIFLIFGTNHWYLASDGSTWYVAHIVAITFLLLSLIETFGQQRLWVIGLFFGLSFWSRTTVIFTLPFFYIFLYRKFYPLNKTTLLNFFLLNFGVALFVFLDAYYNFVRFGNFSPFAPYNLLPTLKDDVVFQNGFMRLEHIPRHLEAIFKKIPQFIPTYPYLTPSLYSTALWFTSPLLFYVLKIKKNLLTLACWAAILPTLFIIMLWAGVGYAQFGYRFAQDFMPFLLILTAIGIGQKPSKFVYFLLLLSILVNLWGVIFINKLHIFTI